MSSQTPVGLSSQPLKAIGLKIASVAVLVTMMALIKAAGRLPAGQMVFFRSFFAVLPILVMLAWQKELRGALYTQRPLNHLLRGLVGVSAMSLMFIALTRLPLPEVTALNYAQPLLVVVFGALFFGETVRVFRWTAVVVGLVGVVIVSWPNLTVFRGGSGLDDDALIGVAAALAGAAVSALAMLLIRGLVRTEKSSTVVLWFSLTASAAALLTLPFGWAPLTTMQTIFLVSAGICGGIGQLLMTQSYRYAQASTIAPFEYTSLLLAIAIGYLAFGDLPTLHTLVGGAIVIAAGIFIIFREHRLGLERSNAKKVAPPQ